MYQNDNARFPILFVSLHEKQNDTGNNTKGIKSKLVEKNHHIINITMADDVLSVVKRETGIGCIIIHGEGDFSEPTQLQLIQGIISIIREKNRTLPIFLSSSAPRTTTLPIEIVKEVQEYIDINQDTASFISGRIHLAIHHYMNNLLPPYFSALKNYATDSPYYWDCPGHQGGVAYLKHPVGREFIHFFGENIMRADIGIATPEMGDWLEHKGVPGTSEQRAATLFGADKTFYVTGGSSQSNQIVGHSLPLKNKIALVDRNCHKSVNHELTISQAHPIYFQPSRNGYGIIGLISPDQFERHNIQAKIARDIAGHKVNDQEPAYAVITNCTYDGLIYNVTALTKTLANSVPRIKFDEAWYAYARFHPLYKGRYAMGVPKDLDNLPTLYAVQSTHKMLAAFSSTSMIHIRNSERAPVNYDVFNQSFMMHGTTSPFYPLIASMDVATAMMEGEPGRAMLNDAINDAIGFRKALVMVAQQLQQKTQEWFFNVWQPTTIRHNKKVIPFVEVPNDVLANDANCWLLRTDDKWHGFEKVPDNYAMLDPIKVTITCPGINAQGDMSDFGIPAPVVSKYLDTQRIIPARNGDYNILILFALGSTQGKWNTLIELLMMFKKHHDNNAPLSEILPDVYASSSVYQNMGLADLCRAIHQANRELKIAALSDLACSVKTTLIMTPYQAYEQLIAGNTELVEVSKISGRTLGVMVTPYPPGIPLIMPGEKIETEAHAIVDYLVALQNFGMRFPGFEHELQGVEIKENGIYCVRCIKESSLNE